MNRALLKKAAQVAKFDPKMAYEMVEVAVDSEALREMQMMAFGGAIEGAISASENFLKSLENVEKQANKAGVVAGLPQLRSLIEHLKSPVSKFPKLGRFVVDKLEETSR